MNTERNTILTLKEACEILRVSRYTLRAEIQHGLPIIQLGRRKYIALSALEEWIDGGGSLGKHDA